MLLSVLFTLSLLGIQSINVCILLSSAFVSLASPTQHSKTFYEVIVGQNSGINGSSPDENKTPIEGRSNKESGNDYNNDPELVRDYVDLVYDNFSMLKDKEADKKDKEKVRKKKDRKRRKKKRRRKKNKRKKKYKKRYESLGSKLEYGEDYENRDIDYQDDYGGTMKFISRRKLDKMKKHKKKRRQKKRRRRRNKKKQKKRKWKTITLN